MPQEKRSNYEMMRVNYFQGMMLVDQDFKDEQDYHRQMRHNHNLELHTWGVVRGLVVEVKSGEVTVTAGVAIDAQGKEIWWKRDDTTRLRVTNREEKYLVIKWKELLSVDYLQMEGEHLRILDTAEFLLKNANEKTDDDLVLAWLSQGRAENNVRRNASIARENGADVEISPVTKDGSLRFMTGAPLTTRLTIAPSGYVGIATPSPQAPLHIKGNGGILNLEGGTHCYIQWFPLGFDNERKGWIGYGAANEKHFTVQNESADGDIVLRSATGRVRIERDKSSAGALRVGRTPGNIGGASFFYDVSAMFACRENNGGSSPKTPETVMVFAREGVEGQSYANFARFDLGMYEGIGSKSQLDIRLSHNSLNREVDNTPVIMSLRSNGNVGIGTTAPDQRLQVDRGNILVKGDNNFAMQGNEAYVFLGDTSHYIKSINASGVRIGTVGALDGITLLQEGNVGIGTNDPKVKLDVNGIANIWSGTRYAILNNKMAPGSLTIGNSSANFGGGSGWNANTAGLLLETLDNTEIAVHDTGKRVASLMYYEGGNINRITIGRDMGWDTISHLILQGAVGIGRAPRTEFDTGTGIMSGAANDYQKAQYTMSGGGVVTWGGPGGRLKWTNRFIAISMGGKPESFSDGHVSIYQPTTDIPADRVHDGVARSANADGVILNGWEALYIIHAPGQVYYSFIFQIVDYRKSFHAPSNWLLIAVVNAEDRTIKLGTGVVVSAKSSISKSSSLPCGTILMWSGAINQIPEGWAICDGNNSTPNLYNRFIVAAGSAYGVGATGGLDAVALTVAQLPAHNHDNGEYNQLVRRSRAGEEVTTDGVDTGLSGTEPDVTRTETIRSTGWNEAHENRPPYYALAYIMKLYS